MSERMPKHWFLQPSMEDPFYVCGGWQIFNRTCELAGRMRETELVTYRHREAGHRYLDDVPRSELNEGIVWLYWSAHVRELAERLAGCPRVVLYGMNEDYGRHFGQITPPRWPIVALSRFVAAHYAVRDPWRLIHHLGPALHPDAANRRCPRDIDVLVHVRKTTSYLRNELIPALEGRLAVRVLREWVPQEEMLELLNRSRTYLYWVHKQIHGMWIYEGFGMQPLEAIVCGATPVANAYGGLSDYLEAPYNSRKIGVHSLEYDVLQIERAAREHDGGNPDEERLRQLYGEERFARAFEAVERDLLFYFERRPPGPPQEFDIQPPRPPLRRRPYVWLHRTVRRVYKELRGIRPR